MRDVVCVGIVALALGACGGTGTGGDDTGGGSDAGSGSGSNTGVWTELISKNWSLQPHSENENEIAILTLDRDIYVVGIRPIDPPGTHHTLLFRGLQGTNAIYASGVGTGELMFPPGKGLKFAANTTIGAQLHIYNTGDEVLTGLSGVEILEADAASITDEVDLFLPGPGNGDLSIPTGVTTQTGTCTVNSTQNVFALFPHMHVLGVHMKTTLTVGGSDMVIHDADYDFEHQDVKTFTPITLNAGDKIKSDCTYNNPGGTVGYGESSDTEMCYSILYRWPRGTQEFCND
jgi:Copper type II ascorbate-dependent monooxygenase, C-terminal domain